MEKIKDICKVEPGDFLNYHGALSLVVSIERDQENCIITLDDGTTIVEKLTSRLEFFRALDRINLGI